MSINGFDVQNAAREIKDGLVSLGSLIERATESFVAMQREKSQHGIEAIEQLTSAITEVIEELRKP